ncbi:flavin-dependent oxidoreductase [Pseudoglutamicibacter albus]|uniref:Alkanesulfonate monooxygenase SsuD/methylene tetrahydromethanopterin reductase-like flavin-dependent oxidoreductase (Luciferase family) n=1 Tax=Pseudoglutamicibacter albus TaxID=98671 RepID=A0ABU1Z063_9MICC|nr:flavin-dependent oxidoreductase [Pseudoglutamicibacter albus]MDR7294010.1 alkanesulfonate monooxygenase SsuD/methylene tetrahydromethanopterin reductase-like flavin-dependent oxidoreductase (luciferase family) [Pseudoglutamicibacter albus]
MKTRSTSAEQAAKDGLNLMSSTLVSETTAETLGEIQADQISRYRAAWKEAGHDWTPRVSVSRSIFPIVDGVDMQMFGMQASGSDQVGTLPDVGSTTFGRTYTAEPDKLIEQLKADAAVISADTLLITIPTGMGVDVNVKILDNFATHVAPALGWQPNHKSPVTGYPID